MRIRRNSEYAKRYYLKEVCIVNQNPWDILGPLIESQSQNSGENDDFCGLASSGKTVKDLLSEIEAEEGKDKAENKAVHCSFTDASGINCGVEAKADSQYRDVHLSLPKKSVTARSGTRGKRGVKKLVLNRLLKRKRKTEDFLPKRKRKTEDLIPGEEIVYYAGFPGLRRKRGCPTLRNEAAVINVMSEIH